MNPLMDKIAIIGYDMTKFGDLYHLGLGDLTSLAITGALNNAGLDRSEVEALYVGNAGSGKFLGQEHLGCLVATESGLDCQSFRIEASGASGAVAMRIASHGILTGYIDKAVVVGVEKMTSFSKSSDTQTALSTSLDSIWESAMGGTLAASFALMTKAYARKYGLTDEQRAQVAVKNHNNAQKNPRAQFKNKITAKNVLGAKMLADPLTLFEGCASSDGAAALVLCAPEIAESYDSEPIYLRASKQAHAPLALQRRESLSEIQSIKKAADSGYKQLNISPKDISIAEVHDVLTIAEILAIEGLGLVELGQGGIATIEGKTALDGDIPVNTSGGLKARGHPIGASGVAQAIEILEQFKNKAGDRQVKEINWGITQSMGGTGGTSVVSYYSR